MLPKPKQKTAISDTGMFLSVYLNSHMHTLFAVHFQLNAFTAEQKCCNIVY